jgi:hypothetical protein
VAAVPRRRREVLGAPAAERNRQRLPAARRRPQGLVQQAAVPAEMRPSRCRRSQAGAPGSAGSWGRRATPPEQQQPAQREQRVLPRPSQAEPAVPVSAATAQLHQRPRPPRPLRHLSQPPEVGSRPHARCQRATPAPAPRRHGLGAARRRPFANGRARRVVHRRRRCRASTAPRSFSGQGANGHQGREGPAAAGAGAGVRAVAAATAAAAGAAKASAGGMRRAAHRVQPRPLPPSSAGGTGRTLPAAQRRRPRRRLAVARRREQRR